jgi:hypothetical protein
VGVAVALIGAPPSLVSMPLSVGVGVPLPEPVGGAVGDMPPDGVAVPLPEPVGGAVGDMPPDGVAVPLPEPVVVGVADTDTLGVADGLAAGEAVAAHDGDGVEVAVGDGRVDGTTPAAVFGLAEVAVPAVLALGSTSRLLQCSIRDAGQAAEGAALADDAALLDAIGPRLVGEA